MLPRELANRNPSEPTAALHCYWDTTPRRSLLAKWNACWLEPSHVTPGLILGRFKLANDTPTRPVNLITGAGYQVAVTPNPVTQNNFVGTIRVTF